MAQGQLLPLQCCDMEDFELIYRYPTSYPDGPAAFASKLSEDHGWKASEGLEFLNDWKYKLGAELLTPFGRSQLCASQVTPELLVPLDLKPS